MTVRFVRPARSRGLIKSELAAGATSQDTVSPSATCSTTSSLAKTISVAMRNTPGIRSEEHTSELQSLMRISYAVFCLQKKKKQHQHHNNTTMTTHSPTIR